MRSPRSSEPFLSDPQSIVSGAFDAYDDAEAATIELLEGGFEVEQLSLLLSEESRIAYLDIHPDLVEEGKHVLAQTVPLERESKTLKGTGAGGAIGGTLGAAAGALAAIGTAVAIPPLGIVVAGPLALGLAGAGAGGAAGSLIGALTGAGMTEYRAERFEELIRDGDVILTVRPHTEPERSLALDVIRQHGGALVDREPTE